MKVLRLGGEDMTVHLGGDDVEMLRFAWRDGSESAYAETEDGPIQAYSLDRVPDTRVPW